MARIARIVGGFTLIIAGIFMLVLPGPGILTILGGLALLSKDIAWAGRLADRVKQKFGNRSADAPDDSTGGPTNPSLNGEKADPA